MQYWTCPECGANLDPSEKCDCNEKKETDPRHRVRPHGNDSTNSLSIYSRYVKEQPSRALKVLREESQASGKEIVGVVKQLYPKFDKSLLSKCENGDVYGVDLRPDAMEALIREFGSEVVSDHVTVKKERHRLTCRISARLEDAQYDLLQQHIKIDGFGTMQDWLSYMVRTYLAKRVTS